MINSAYNGFTDLISSFTRAGGAAQRVLSLMDMLPDIDPTAGLALTAPLRGEITFEDVAFTYQMRPDRPVLTKYANRPLSPYYRPVITSMLIALVALLILLRSQLFCPCPTVASSLL